MHRGRFGGNARKRKAKLTDATFHAMIGSAAAEDAPVAVLELSEVAITATLVAAEAVVARHAAGEPGIARREYRDFRPEEYVFGYVSCAHCHNDQAYYLHQADVAAGYTFRCRVCRMEIALGVES